MADTHLTAPTRIIEVEGDRFAYRRWGNPACLSEFKLARTDDEVRREMA
jgi:hypothetical protein